MFTNLIHKPLIILAVSLSTNIEPAKLVPSATVPYPVGTNQIVQVMVPPNAPLTNLIRFDIFQHPITNVFTNYSFGYLDGTNEVTLGKIVVGPER